MSECTRAAMPLYSVMVGDCMMANHARARPAITAAERLGEGAKIFCRFFTDINGGSVSEPFQVWPPKERDGS